MNGPPKWSFDFHEYSQTAWFGTLTTVVGVLAGFWGSVFTLEIRGAFPFFWGPFGPICMEAVTFWVLLTLFAAMFFGVNRGAHVARAHEQKSQAAQTDRLATLVQSLPPEGFLADFASVYGLCHEALSNIQAPATPTLEQIDKSIRVVIKGLIHLASAFDGKPHQARYAANIMIFRRPPFGAAEGESIRQLLRFVPATIDLQRLKGVLKVELALSTATDAGESEVDPKLEDFCLPVTVTYQNDAGRWYILPGAPMAFATKSMQGYADCSTLRSWCETSGIFDPDVCVAVGQYFDGPVGQIVGSFVSFPLKDDAMGDPLGILNIHRNSKELLRYAAARGASARPPAATFYLVAQPVLAILSDMVAIRIAAVARG